MKNTKLLVLSAVLGVFAAVAFAGVASAQGMPAGSAQGGFMGHGRGFGGPGGYGGNTHMMGKFPGIFGTVTAINGTTLSVQSIQFSTSTKATSTVTYSVDASNATVEKDNVTSTVSAIDTGDMVMVRGTVSGMSVTATSISDGQFMGRGQGGRPFGNATDTPPFGNGTSTPSISGTVSAVSGSTLTVTGTDGTTYTVDATNATLIKKGSLTSSISGINVGDDVQIQGTINGTSVTATVVLDNVPTTSSTHPGGFIGTLRSFFANLFHFRF